MQGRGTFPPLPAYAMAFKSASELVESRPELAAFQFDWAALPGVTGGTTGTGGRIFCRVEDFVVSELSAIQPSGKGDYVYAYVEKRGLNTHDLVAALRERGVPYREVGIAGLKDRQAVTRQWLSVPLGFSEQLSGLDELDGVAVLDMSRHESRLRRGQLRGNRFEARVREPEPGWERQAGAIIEGLRQAGLPNYFGPQRFGRFNSNAIDAVRMLQGEKVPGGKRLNEFFISALQAHLFNWNLKRRIESGIYDRVLTGDRARRHDTGGMFLVGDGAEESERAQRLEISAALPLYGRKVSGGLEAAAQHEEAILTRFGLRRSDFRRHTRGAWRVSRVCPEDIALRPCTDGYVAEFTLPSGSYATTLLRELTKSVSNSAVVSAETG